ncbi:MAG: hypothetical protein L6V93_07450 [Clostridiales bacterium]|nr:MAG: hypothetical protein L6V93_07450 [Clostridiales bacterium]
MFSDRFCLKLGVGKEGMTFFRKRNFFRLFTNGYIIFRAFFTYVFSTLIWFYVLDNVNLSKGLSGAKPVLCSYGSGVGGVFQRKKVGIKSIIGLVLIISGVVFFGKRIEKLAYIQCILYKNGYFFTLFIQKA